MSDTRREITKNTPLHLIVKNVVTTTDDASVVYNMTRRMSLEIFDSMGTYIIIICRYKHIKNTVTLRLRYIFIYLFFSFEIYPIYLTI